MKRSSALIPAMLGFALGMFLCWLIVLTFLPEYRYSFNPFLLTAAGWSGMIAYRTILSWKWENWIERRWKP